MLSAKATSTKNETDKKKDTRKTVYFDDEKRSQFRELLLDLSKSRELQEHLHKSLNVWKLFISVMTRK